MQKYSQKGGVPNVFGEEQADGQTHRRADRDGQGEDVHDDAADLLYHALKSAATYHAMKDSEGWEDKDASGRSYRRGRDSMGRYVSRDMRPDYDGWSGHYPDMMPPYYPGRY